MIKKKPPIKVRTELVLVDGAEAKDPQDASLGIDATIDISPPKVSSVSRKVLSCLSQLPQLQLEVYRSPSYHP